MRRRWWEIPLALLALMAGLLGGLYYAWVVAPVRYVDTEPSTLRADFKDQFRTLIATSYAATHNLDRARARLALLGDPDAIESLSAQAQRMLAAGQSFQVVQDVAGLASDLRSGAASIPPIPTSTSTAKSPTSVAIATPSPPPTQQVNLAADSTATATATTTATAATPTVPNTPVLDTPTARPTRTPMPTASAPFQLVSQTDVCNPNLTNGLMQISILDSHRHQMPGVVIDLSWSGGEEAFFTGLKPEIADGYADYVMQAGVVYSIQINRSGTPVSGLIAPSCPDSGGQTYLGGLKLVFQQP